MIVESIRKYFVRKQSRIARHTKDALQRGPGNFAKATQIGILFNLEENEDHHPLEAFVKWLETENKKLRILTYLENYRSLPCKFYYDHFGLESINQWGQITASRVEQFIEIPFDFLYCIYTQPQPLFDTILHHSKARCRVGPYDEQRINLYEIMVRPDENHLAAIVHQMKHLSEILKNND